MRTALIKADDSTGTKQSIRQGWDEVAVEYTKDRLGIFERYAGRLLELLHPSSGSSILDVGCGSGAVTLQATTWAGPEGLVIGSDIAVTMLNLGRAKAEDEKADVMFCQVDAERLGFRNASFDSVTCAFSLFQFTDMEMALIEMWRVLKPGGRLGLSNWGTGYFSPIASIQRDLFRTFNIKPLLNNPLSFKPSELNELLTRTGYSGVELIEETDEVWFNTAEEIWAFNMDMGPFPIMLRQQLSLDQQRRLFHQFNDAMGNLLTERGIKSTFHLIYALAGKGDID
jgi:ubiquinone/menaquinone biosynthesis C-methylase UbiE